MMRKKGQGDSEVTGPLVDLSKQAEEKPKKKPEKKEK